MAYHDEDSFIDTIKNALVNRTKRKNVFIYTIDAFYTAPPQFYEEILVRRANPKDEMTIMIEEFGEMLRIDASDMRLYRWRICQTVRLTMAIHIFRTSSIYVTSMLRSYLFQKIFF